MVVRFAAGFAVVAVLALPSIAAAQESAEPDVPTVSITGNAAKVRFVVDQEASQVTSPTRFNSSWKTPLLNSLHAVSIATQLLDAHSTIKAIDRGGVEANPLMRGLIDNRPAFIGVKAAGAAGLVYLTHKLWKRNKTAAIITSAAINSLYIVKVTQNYGIARN
jgi:Domain of unknown function (DUF5658)